MRQMTRTVRRIRGRVGGASVDYRAAFTGAAVTAACLILGTAAALADTPAHAAGTSAPRASGRSAPSRPAATAALSQVLTKAVERGDTPAVVGLIVDRDGVLFEAAAGKLDDSHPTLPTDEIFNIASMTKPVTSVAIMMLAEQGKLSIDDPVSRYLPGFDNLQVITRF